MKRERILAAFLFGVLSVGLAGCSQAAKPSSGPSPVPSTTGTETPPQPSSVPGEGSRVTTRRILSRVLREFTNSVEMLSPSGARRTIDADRFFGYPRFEEELTVFLRSLGELRLFVREVSVQVGVNRAVMLVDAEMGFSLRRDPSQSSQRRAQIQFDFQRTEQGWKITEITPRTFFLP